MNREQSKAVGGILRAKRQALGYSTYRLAEAAGVQQSTVVRIERGEFAAPRPDKLARFADLLGLTLADVFAVAGYLVPSELPHFEAFLMAKYPRLPVTAVVELCRRFEEILIRHDLPTDYRMLNGEEAFHDNAGGVA